AFVYEAQTNVLGKLAPLNPGEGYELEAWEVAEQGKARALMDLLEDGSTRSVSVDRAWKDVGQGVDLATLRTAALPTDKDLILEYALGDSGSYVWAITRKGMTLHRLPDKKKIQDTSRLLRRSLEEDVSRLRGRAPTTTETPVLSWRDHATALGDMLLAPVAEVVQMASRVAIIPDGALHYVPFEMLVQGSSKQYALEGKTVRYAPSAGVLARLSLLQRHPGLPEPFLGVGDPVFNGQAAKTVASVEPVVQGAFRSGIPGTGETRLLPLPNTRKEVITIGQFFDKERPRLLLGAEATEANLKEPGFLSRFRILHFATHGLTDERFPKRCCLALSAADSASDAFLEAEEIYALPVRADLVVLSACETGKGRMVRGEGVLGLPRAFLHAGARNVVVSLWSVSDEGTADLMTSFYREMIQKKRPAAEALARAKQDMMRSDEWHHPFYWAGFVLIGPGQ
ncbi:MAG TPA: CHAT domain-containing protein, partial [Candidatus Eisenbacteria bacterium]|nr:CHAT domain-containing protein [Candidatus Eisenbacteria bacterium]